MASEPENAPEIRSVGRVLPAHYADQEMLIAAFRKGWAEQHHNLERLEELHRAVQVNGRYLALPIAEYGWVVDATGSPHGLSSAARRSGAIAASGRPVLMAATPRLVSAGTWFESICRTRWR